MTCMLIFLALSAIIYGPVVIHGHLCLISPPQRGTISGLNKPASQDCLLLKSPCGGRNPTSKTFLPGGLNHTVTFQKNLDHYVKTSPGYFSIGITGKDSEEFKEYIRIPDNGEPSLHLYSAVITLPVVKGDVKTVVLQVKYVTNNPNAPAVFYQCSDIWLYS